MGSDNRADNRMFKSNFTAEGAAMLRERVNEKLKEYMGHYSDDTLVVRAQRRAYRYSILYSPHFFDWCCGDQNLGSYVLFNNIS